MPRRSLRSPTGSHSQDGWPGRQCAARPRSRAQSPDSFRRQAPDRSARPGLPREHGSAPRIGLRIYGDRADAHVPGRAHDAAGDLSAIGDEQRARTWRLTSGTRRSASRSIGAFNEAESAKRQDAARVERVDDSVVPQPRGGIIGIALASRIVGAIGALKASSSAPPRCRPWLRCRRAGRWPARWRPARRP